MSPNDHQLAAYLLGRDLITEDQLATARGQQSRGDSRSLHELILAAGWLNSDQLTSISSTVSATSSPGVLEPEGTIAGYRLLSILGAGGAGVVYRARDPEGRELALKLILEADPRDLLRFEREARITAELAGAGFVPLIEAGSSPRGPYLALELMPGGSLADRLKAAREPQGVDEGLRLLRRLAWSMGRAHAAGVIHRDLKPANILFDAEGAPRIADLGIARHLNAKRRAAEASLSLTREGAVLGTLAYMAPEQLEDSKSVGPQADVYALGAIAYECLTGRRLYEGGSSAALMLRATRGRWTPIRELRPDCPQWLARVIERCLAADPDRRFADARVLAARLERARRPKKISRLAWLSAVLLIGALAFIPIAALSALSQARAPKPPATTAQAPRPELAAPPRPVEPRRPPPLRPLGAGLILNLIAAESEADSDPQAEILALAASADGRRLAAFDAEGRLMVWSRGREGAEPLRSRPLSVVPIFDKAAPLLSLSPDGRTVALGLGSQVTVWSEDRSSDRTSTPAPVSSLLVRSEDEVLAGLDSGLILRLTKEGARSLRPPQDNGAARELTPSRNGVIATYARGAQVEWSEEGKPSSLDSLFEFNARRILLDDAGERCIFYAVKSDLFYAVKIEESVHRARLFVGESPASALALRGDGRRAAVAWESGGLRLYDLDARSPIRLWEISADWVITALVFADEDRLLIGTRSGLIGLVAPQPREEESADGR